MTDITKPLATITAKIGLTLLAMAIIKAFLPILMG